jgi:hypothetical protein
MNGGLGYFMYQLLKFLYGEYAMMIALGMFMVGLLLESLFRRGEKHREGSCVEEWGAVWLAVWFCS